MSFPHKTDMSSICTAACRMRHVCLAQIAQLAWPLLRGVYVMQNLRVWTYILIAQTPVVYLEEQLFQKWWYALHCIALHWSKISRKALMLIMIADLWWVVQVYLCPIYRNVELWDLMTRCLRWCSPPLKSTSDIKSIWKCTKIWPMKGICPLTFLEIVCNLGCTLQLRGGNSSILLYLYFSNILIEKKAILRNSYAGDTTPIPTCFLRMLPN